MKHRHGPPRTQNGNNQNTLHVLDLMLRPLLLIRSFTLKVNSVHQGISVECIGQAYGSAWMWTSKHLDRGSGRGVLFFPVKDEG